MKKKKRLLIKTPITTNFYISLSLPDSATTTSTPKIHFSSKILYIYLQNYCKSSQLLKCIIKCTFLKCIINITIHVKLALESNWQMH